MALQSGLKRFLFQTVPKITRARSLDFLKSQSTAVRSFSTTKSKNAIPPLVWLIFKPVTKLGAIIAGRGFRNWWVSLPKMKRQIFKGHLIRNKYRYILFIGSTVSGSIVYYQVHLQETPITHRQRFILFTTKQLEEIENLEKDEVSAAKMTCQQKKYFKMKIKN